MTSPASSTTSPSDHPLATAPGDARPSRTARVTPRAIWARLDDGWRLALGLLLAQRLVLALIGLQSAITADHLKRPGDVWPRFVLPGGEPWSLLLTTWHHWDAVRYHSLAQSAYAGPPGTVEGGLYPLYPLLSRVVSFFVGGHILWAELLLSSACFVVGLRLVYALAGLEVERAEAQAVPAPKSRRRLEANLAALRDRALQHSRAAVLVVALFPAGFFLLAPYTESLFLALTVASLWYARRGVWWLAGLTGLLAALTRFPGVFLVGPLVYEYIRQGRAAPTNPSGRSDDTGIRRWLRWDAVATTLPLLGGIITPFAIGLIRGSDRAAFAVRYLEFSMSRVSGQRSAADLYGGFGLQVVPPWELLAASTGYVTRWVADPPTSLPIIEALNLAVMFGFIGLAVVATIRLPRMYAFYIWPSLLLLLTRQAGFSPLMGATRYLMVISPCLLVLALLLANRQRLFRAYLIGSAALQGALFWYFARAGFVA